MERGWITGPRGDYLVLAGTQRAVRQETEESSEVAKGVLFGGLLWFGVRDVGPGIAPVSMPPAAVVFQFVFPALFVVQVAFWSPVQKKGAAARVIAALYLSRICVDVSAEL